MRAALSRWRHGMSMRGRLLWGILLPVGLLVAINTASLYRQTEQAAKIGRASWRERVCT